MYHAYKYPDLHSIRFGLQLRVYSLRLRREPNLQHMHRIEPPKRYPTIAWGKYFSKMGSVPTDIVEGYTETRDPPIEG